MRILIVEDDSHLAAALARILEDNDNEVDVVHDGAAGVVWATTGDYDVIILDVMLPKKDGFTVTTELRRAHINTPILLLTARDGTSDKIAGYDSGADDYMTKPFSPAELMAHLRALTRRQGDVVFERIDTGDLSLDLESYDLTCNGKSIHLSYKEFSIAKILLGSPGAVISKETLLAKAWGIDSSAGDNNVEAYISFLRKKLAHLGSTAKIETLRKAGYRFVDGAESASGDDASGGRGEDSADDATAALRAEDDTALIPETLSKGASEGSAAGSDGSTAQAADAQSNASSGSEADGLHEHIISE